MTADHFALVADLLDARVNLHLPAVLIGLFVSDPRMRAVREKSVGSGVVTPVETVGTLKITAQRPERFSAVTEDNATTGQVIRTEFHHHAVLREDPDVVLTHLARNVSENLVAVGELHAEHSVRQSLHDHTFDLDDTVLLRHVLRIP